MNIIPFKPDHFYAMNLQPQQMRCLSYASFDYVDKVGTSGPAVSAEVDGRIVAVGGVAQIGLHGFAWACFDKGSGRYFIRFIRIMRRMLEIAALPRIEATVECDFMEGCRMLGILGFAFEGRMAKYGPQGEDHFRYARVA